MTIFTILLVSIYIFIQGNRDFDENQAYRPELKTQIKHCDRTEKITIIELKGHHSFHFSAAKYIFNSTEIFFFMTRKGGPTRGPIGKTV